MSRGCNAIDIRIVDRRTELPPFYRSLGFVDNGTEPFDDPLLTKPCHFIRMTKELATMCRNIKTLFNFDPPATDEEIRAASLQFVRKLSGFNAPSKANEAAFEQAIDEVAAVARRLIDSLSTNAAPRNREEVAAAARLRSAERFGAPR